MTHIIVTGLGFGDESKGATVDYICATRDIKAVIRHNGGPQAAHNVVQPDGRWHTFAQFGSGTFHGVPTHLSQFMLVNPFNMVPEADHLMDLGLPDPLLTTTIDERALLVTPYHRAANRLREDARDASRHGSTGQGVGETMAYDLANAGLDNYWVPRVGDLRHRELLERKLHRLRDYYDQILDPGDFFVACPTSPYAMSYNYADVVDRLNIVGPDYIDTLLDSGDCVFEGAQGVLLDENLGFNPHTTWSTTTQFNARVILGDRDAECWGLTRSYHTRHGAGPFPTEGLDVTTLDFPEPHNGTGKYQGAWRVGALDLSLLDYAIRANGGIDKLVVSHMDYVGNAMCQSYFGYEDWSVNVDWTGPSGLIIAPGTYESSFDLAQTMYHAQPTGYDMADNENDLLDAITSATGHRPYLLSYGPTWKDRRLADVRAVL